MPHLRTVIAPQRHRFGRWGRRLLAPLALLLLGLSFVSSPAASPEPGDAVDAAASHSAAPNDIAPQPYGPSDGVAADPRTPMSSVRTTYVTTAHWTEDDGFRVVLVQRQGTLVTFDLVIGSGAADDPPDRNGLANLTAQLLLFGTPELPRYALQDRLDDLGARLEVHCDETSTILRGEVLPRNADALLALLAELLAAHTVRDEDVRKAVREVKSALAFDRENDRLLGMRFFRRLVYANHPYGNWVQGTQRSLAALDAKDVARFRATHYVRANIILAASGSLHASHLREHMPLAPDGLEAPVQPRRRFPSHGSRQVLLVDKPDRTQNQIFVGQRISAPSDDDWNAMRVASAILGGNFSSRLNRDLRARRGWTYAIESELWRAPRAGTLVIWTFVAPELAPKALAAIVGHLEAIVRDGVSAEEVENATGYVAGNLVLDHATPAEMALESARWLHYGQPMGSFVDKANAIKALRVDDVRRAIAQMVTPQALDIAMTCTAEHFERILVRFPGVGSVQVAAYDEQ